MVIGDDALAAGMDIVDGNSTLANTIDTEINKSRDYLAQRTAAITPVSKGGTGADTPAAARVNLDVPGWGDTSHDPSPSNPGKVMRFNTAGQGACLDPTSGLHTANKRYVDGKAGVPSGGGTFTGDVYFPNATPATSSYAVAYINGDGRLSRNASSERYKEHIEQVDPAALGDVFPVLHRYQMIDGDGSWKVGYIAERLAEHPDQQPFVVYSEFAGELIPESIDFIALLMAQNAQLRQQLDLLAQRLTTLEAR